MDTFLIFFFPSSPRKKSLRCSFPTYRSSKKTEGEKRISAVCRSNLPSPPPPFKFSAVSFFLPPFFPFHPSGHTVVLQCTALKKEAFLHFFSPNKRERTDGLPFSSSDPEKSCFFTTSVSHLKIISLAHIRFPPHRPTFFLSKCSRESDVSCTRNAKRARGIVLLCPHKYVLFLENRRLWLPTTGEKSFQS